MNYEKFRETLAEEVRRQAEGRLLVRLETVTKNNGVKADALELRERGSRFAPLLYLDSFYEQYLRGVGVSHLASLVLDCYEEFSKNPPAAAEFIQIYEKASPSIFCKVINYEKNLGLLEEVPHEKWMDLAVVYYYQMEIPGAGNAAVLIRNSHLEQWGITESVLRERAWSNTVEKLRPVCRRLSEILAEDERFEEEQPEGMAAIYLLTNTRKYLGAICIHYPGMAEQIGESLKSDYYVLPSSIHECLILPAEGFSEAQLKTMVEEINETRLPPQEVLSNQVYYYDRNLRRLAVAREA